MSQGKWNIKSFGFNLFGINAKFERGGSNSEGLDDFSSEDLSSLVGEIIDEFVKIKAKIPKLEKTAMESNDDGELEGLDFELGYIDGLLGEFEPVIKKAEEMKTEDPKTIAILWEGMAYIEEDLARIYGVLADRFE